MKLHEAGQILVVVASLGEAQAQSVGWQAVKQLVPGTRISVKTHFRTICDFTVATDDELVCEEAHRRFIPIPPPECRFERKQVREVRFEHSDASKARVGAVVGGGAGAAVGAIVGNKTLTREGSALLLGTTGALVGGTFGPLFPITHGPVVYRRPKSKKAQALFAQKY